jgi:hypothetical protein
MGVENVGVDGPFTVIRSSANVQMHLAPWRTEGFEHYAFSVTKTAFDDIFRKVQESGLDYGPTCR